MGGNLILITLIVTAFTFIFYRGLYLRRTRMGRYKAYATAVQSVLRQHFAELKSKNDSLTIDNGYGIIDKKAWNDELHSFVSETIFSALAPGKKDSIRTNPVHRMEFTIFTVNHIEDLLGYATHPEKFEYQNTINSIEDLDRVDSFLMGTPSFVPSKALTYKV